MEVAEALEDLGLERDEPPDRGDDPQKKDDKPKGGRVIDEAKFKCDSLSKDDGGSGLDDPEWMPRGRAAHRQQPVASSAPPQAPPAAVAGGSSVPNGWQLPPPHPQLVEQKLPPIRWPPGSSELPSSNEAKVQPSSASAEAAAGPSPAGRPPVPSRIPVRNPGRPKGGRSGLPGGSQELRSLGMPKPVPQRRANQGGPPLRTGATYGCVNTYVAAATTPTACTSKAVGGKPRNSAGAHALPDLLGLGIREADIVIPTTWAEMKASPLYPYW